MEMKDQREKHDYFKNLMDELLRIRDDFLQHRQSLDQVDHMEARDLEYALNSTIQKASALRMIFYCKTVEES
jgi:hypothetical protein